VNNLFLSGWQFHGGRLRGFTGARLPDALGHALLELFDLVRRQARKLALHVKTQAFAQIDYDLAIHAESTRQRKDSDLFLILGIFSILGIFDFFGFFALLQAVLLRDVPLRPASHLRWWLIL
jgi:hypothetical protein